MVFSAGSHKAVLIAQTCHWEWPQSENTGTETHPEIELVVKWSKASLGPLALKTQVLSFQIHQFSERIQFMYQEVPGY